MAAAAGGSAEALADHDGRRAEHLEKPTGGREPPAHAGHVQRARLVGQGSVEAGSKVTGCEERLGLGGLRGE
jgi:hypothetical protein